VAVSLNEFQLVDLIDHGPSAVIFLEFDRCHDETVARLNSHYGPLLTN